MFISQDLASTINAPIETEYDEIEFDLTTVYMLDNTYSINSLFIELSQQTQKIQDIIKVVTKLTQTDLTDTMVDHMYEIHMLEELCIEKEELLERSISGRKDLLEGSLEGFISDNIVKLMEFIRMIIRKIQSIFNWFMGLHKKYITDPKSPFTEKNISKFYSKYSATLQSSVDIIEIVPLMEYIGILNVISNIANDLKQAIGRRQSPESIKQYFSSTDVTTAYQKKYHKTSIYKISTTVVEDKITMYVRRGSVPKVAVSSLDWTTEHSMIEVLDLITKTIKKLNETNDAINQEYNSLAHNAKIMKTTSFHNSTFLAFSLQFQIINGLLTVVQVINNDFRADYQKIRNLATKEYSR